MTQINLKETLQENLLYDNGKFIRVKSNTPWAKVGSIAGWNNSKEYRQIKINGNTYLEHRLVWLWHHGYLPTKQIDHINGDKSDNRIENLREVSNAENQQNRGKTKTNTSGYKGVYKNRNRWMAKIGVDGKDIYLGTFDTAYEAHLTYEKSVLIYHPFTQS